MLHIFEFEKYLELNELSASEKRKREKQADIAKIARGSALIGSIYAALQGAGLLAIAKVTKSAVTKKMKINLARGVLKRAIVYTLIFAGLETMVLSVSKMLMTEKKLKEKYNKAKTPKERKKIKKELDKIKDKRKKKVEDAKKLKTKARDKYGRMSQDEKKKMNDKAEKKLGK